MDELGNRFSQVRTILKTIANASNPPNLGEFIKSFRELLVNKLLETWELIRHHLLEPLFEIDGIRRLSVKDTIILAEINRDIVHEHFQNQRSIEADFSATLNQLDDDEGLRLLLLVECDDRYTMLHADFVRQLLRIYRAVPSFDDKDFQDVNNIHYNYECQRDLIEANYLELCYQLVLDTFPNVNIASLSNPQELLTDDDDSTFLV